MHLGCLKIMLNKHAASLTFDILMVEHRKFMFLLWGERKGNILRMFC